ncbi:MAG: hypothetical protein IPH77_02275 [Ignavibacteria bacterium]|nr:hypothetical protein [Ignavibacteria bacterium]
MKKFKPTLFIAIVLLVFFFTCKNSFSTTVNVSVSSFQFSPASISVQVGDTVRWNWVNGSHTTTCDGSALTSRPAGAAAWSSSINSVSTTFAYKVTVAGTYNYKCVPHGGGGMVGVITASAPLVTLNLTALMEGFWNGSFTVQDTVRVYLRNQTSPYAIMDQAKIKLSSSGNGTLTFSSAPGGTYYISVIHRNSIETWCKNPQSFTAGTTKIYDFTTGAAQAFGNNMILKSGKYVFYGGDVVRDGTVDASDISKVDNDATLSLSGYVVSDLTGDDFVDAQDLSLVDNNAFNSVSSVLP